MPADSIRTARMQLADCTQILSSPEGDLLGRNTYDAYGWVVEMEGSSGTEEIFDYQRTADGRVERAVRTVNTLRGPSTQVLEYDEHEHLSARDESQHLHTHDGDRLSSYDDGEKLAELDACENPISFEALDDSGDGGLLVNTYSEDCLLASVVTSYGLSETYEDGRQIEFLLDDRLMMVSSWICD